MAVILCELYVTANRQGLRLLSSDLGEGWGH